MNIIVTGGATGIGKVIVEGLVNLNHTVLFTYNSSVKEAVALQEKYSNVKGYKLDITNKEEVDEFSEYIEQNIKDVDVLINNAGISQTKLFTDNTEEDWNYIINTNLKSAFFITQKLSKNMINKKKGLIINISSIWGATGASCEVLYSISKAGLDGFTKSLARELAPCNIRVNSIAPGIIDTNMNDSLKKEEIKQIELQIPLGKQGNAKEIFKCVNWLLEDEYTTGQVIHINGGWYI